MMQERTMQENLENEVVFLSKKILELNKKLIESEKAKSRFLSLVTSELNNPMTVLISIFARLEVQMCEKNKALYPILNQEVLNLEFKIKNLMMAARIENGDLDISHALVAPLDIIDEVIESLKYVIQEKKIHLHVSDLIKEKIIGDPEIIYTIAKNLISNAALYSLEGSGVEIILDKQKSLFTLSVKNDGKAPSFEHKPEIFTRFCDDPKGEHGLGIGLSIVRSLCEYFNGSVDYFVNEESITFIATLTLDEKTPNSQALGCGEFLFDSFEDAIEL